jgi:hypothetical protein
MRPWIASALLATGGVLVLPAGAWQAPAPGNPFSGAIAAMSSPAPDATAQPNLTVDRRGRVWLSWLESRVERGPDGRLLGPGQGGHRFRIAALQPNAAGLKTRGSIDASWTSPVTIAEGANFLANWADFPSVFATRSGLLAAHWLERSGSGGAYAYGVRMSTSSDDGRTWSAPLTPHRDQSPQEHGFVSFFEAPGADLGLVWLDGREMAGGHGAPAAGAGQGTGSMTLRATTLSDGQLGPEMLIDSRVCECCQTSAARLEDGVIVAYRDRSDTEVRDIAVSRFVDGRWSDPQRVHADNWQINACPVNGPAIAASGRAVAIAWYTLAGGAPQAKVAFSTDGGVSFGAPILLNQQPTYGRLGLTMLDADRVLVSSIERGDPGARLLVRDVRRDGRVGGAVQVAETSSDRSSGFPRIVVAAGRVVFAWTETRPRSESPADSRPVTRVRVAAAQLR